MKRDRLRRHGGVRIGAFLLVCAALSTDAGALDIDHDADGNVKLTMKGLPIFDGDGTRESADEGRAWRDDEDADDNEYTIDSLGRRVPVRTRKAPSAPYRSGGL